MTNLQTHEIKTIITGESKGGFFIEFNTPTCNQCRIFLPVLENTAKALNVELYAYNCDQSPEIVDQLEILSVPTVIFFKDGQQAVRFTGLQSMKDMVDAIKPFLKPAKKPTPKTPEK